MPSFPTNQDRGESLPRQCTQAPKGTAQQPANPWEPWSILPCLTEGNVIGSARASNCAVSRPMRKGGHVQEDLELKEATLALYKALESGDASFVREATSTQPGIVLIGTDPDE